MMNSFDIPNTKIKRPVVGFSQRDNLSIIRHADSIKDEVLNDLRTKFKEQEEKIEDEFKVLNVFINNYYKDYVLIHRKLQEAIDLLDKIKSYPSVSDESSTKKDTKDGDIEEMELAIINSKLKNAVAINDYPRIGSYLLDKLDEMFTREHGIHLEDFGELKYKKSNGRHVISYVLKGDTKEAYLVIYHLREEIVYTSEYKVLLDDTKLYVYNKEGGRVFDLLEL